MTRVQAATPKGRAGGKPPSVLYDESIEIQAVGLDTWTEVLWPAPPFVAGDGTTFAPHEIETWGDVPCADGVIGLDELAVVGEALAILARLRSFEPGDFPAAEAADLGYATIKLLLDHFLHHPAMVAARATGVVATSRAGLGGLPDGAAPMA